MAFTQERGNYRDDQKQQEPWREPKDARGKADCGNKLLKQRADSLNHCDPVGRLDPRALQLVIEDRILIGGKI